MSLHYSLFIAEPAQPDALAVRLGGVVEYEPAADDIAAPGLQVRICRPSPVEVEMIAQEFGFTPSTLVTFRVDKEAEPEALRTRLLRGCIALLEGSTGDAVLLLNGETVILLRRGGRLVLNPVEGFWTDEVLAVIRTSHEFEPIPSI